MTRPATHHDVSQKFIYTERIAGLYHMTSRRLRGSRVNLASACRPLRTNGTVAGLTIANSLFRRADFAIFLACL